MLFNLIANKSIQVFTSLQETGSFTNTAKRLHMTQPAVTFQVKSLEDRLGVKLFNRQPVGLTPAGRALSELLDEVSEVLDKHDLESLVGETSDEPVEFAALSPLARQAAVGTYRENLTEEEIIEALKDVKFTHTGQVVV